MDKKESRELKKNKAEEVFRLPSSREGEAVEHDAKAPRERLGTERKTTRDHVADPDAEPP